MGSALIVPVVTRWNSMFDAVTRLLLHEKKIDLLCDSLELTRMTSGDLQYLREYCKIMSPISSTLDFLQREKSMLFGCLIPSLVSLSVKIKRMAQDESLQFLKEMAAALDTKLCARFVKFFTLTPEASAAVVATVLLPDVKMRWFKTLGNRLPSITEQHIHNLVVREIEATVNADDEINHCVSSQSSEDFYDFDGIYCI